MYEGGEAPKWIARAIDSWKTCSNYGYDFPVFLSQERGAHTIRVNLRRRGFSSRCGSFRDSTVTLYGFASTEDGRIKRCPDLPQNLAHELGHVLGLRHAPRTNRCQQHVMSTITNSNSWTRGVTPEACEAVGQMWITPRERNPDFLLHPQPHTTNEELE